MFARIICCALTTTAIGCSFGGSSGDKPEPLGGSLTVTGDVVDFQTREAVASSVSVSSSGITPPPTISTKGSEFTLTDVPEHSIFQLLASASEYSPTFSEVIEVTDQDLDGVKAPAIKASYIEAIATAFGITPTATKGIVIVKLVDRDGKARAGIAASQLVLASAAKGPYFLDAQGNPAVGAQMTTMSGYAVWFEVAPGAAQAAQTAAATVTVNMPASPVAAASVTLATAVVIDGAAPALPKNVSLSGDVMPIFTNRGCLGCHGASGPGSDLGGLDLNGGANKVFGELVTERPGIRINTTTPEASLFLTKPLREEPPNHPTAIFQNTLDADYLKILVWIKEGAKNN
jgi:hypothetical protein